MYLYPLLWLLAAVIGLPTKNRKHIKHTEVYNTSSSTFHYYCCLCQFGDSLLANPRGDTATGPHFFNKLQLIAAFDATTAQKKSEALVGIAAFMGLQCSQEQALRVWNSHQHPLPRGNFSTYGLSPEIIEWMTAVMARLLPPPLAARWGVAPTDLPLE